MGIPCKHIFGNLEFQGISLLNEFDSVVSWYSMCCHCLLLKKRKTFVYKARFVIVLITHLQCKLREGWVICLSAQFSPGGTELWLAESRNRGCLLWKEGWNLLQRVRTSRMLGGNGRDVWSWWFGTRNTKGASEWWKDLYLHLTWGSPESYWHAAARRLCLTRLFPTFSWILL